MCFFTSALVLRVLTVLLLFVLLSCSLESFDACQENGVMECDPERGEQAYRKCSNLRWVEDTCPAPTFCQADACVECHGWVDYCLWLARGRTLCFRALC